MKKQYRDEHYSGKHIFMSSKEENRIEKCFSSCSECWIQQHIKTHYDINITIFGILRDLVGLNDLLYYEEYEESFYHTDYFIIYTKKASQRIQDSDTSCTYQIMTSFDDQIPNKKFNIKDWQRYLEGSFLPKDQINNRTCIKLIMEKYVEPRSQRKEKELLK